MTTLELQQWKKNFVEDYLDEIDDMEMMAKLEKYAKRILTKKVVSPSPIAYSVGEACKEIAIAERELNEGKGINEAEMHQFFGEWKRKLQ